MPITEYIKEKFDTLAPHLNEKITRLWAACEATAIGKGGISLVAQATGLSPKTIRTGIRELEQKPKSLLKHLQDFGKIREYGGGRKGLMEVEPTLTKDLEALINPFTQEHSKFALCWTCKSTAKLAAELQNKGYSISPRKVADLLHQLNYSLKNNRNKSDKISYSDRDAQFQHIQEQVRAFQARGQPVIVANTQKKEVIGEYAKNRQEWQSEQQTDDFFACEIDNQATNSGWVNFGIDDSDMAEFTVNSIQKWWQQMGQQLYPDATEILINRDCGSSNESAAYTWKIELQNFANQSGLKIQVAHLPPSTIKWNRIEHSLFYQITKNWGGGSLTSREVVIHLIGNINTKKDLIIESQLEKSNFKEAKTVSDEKLPTINMEECKFYGQWNYLILPDNRITL